MQLVLQPCADPHAVEHYNETIENPVPLTRILRFLSPTEQERVSTTFGETVAIWGVTPGKNEINAKKWSRMQLGDIALLYRDKHFFFKGEVAYKIRSPELARELWQERPDGATWEYVFFLTDLEQIDIDVSQFNEAAKYKSNYTIQGFNVLPSDLSERIMDALDLEPAAGAILPAEGEIEVAMRSLENLEGELDLPASTRRRAEQALLRKIYLGGKKVEACSICARILPVDLLVIGHIRKRHSCNASQKRDGANVMPVCLLGCDKLFENGYIYVDGAGLIQASHAAKGISPLNLVINSLVGKTCLSWMPASAPYFRWHEERSRHFL